MLFQAGDVAKPRRIQGVFVSEKEVKEVVKFLKDQADAFFEFIEEKETLEESLAKSLEGIGLEQIGELEYDYYDTFDDPLYEQAKEEVIRAGKASASFLQRRLRIGYARAARLLDLLEERKVIGPQEGSKPREVLIKPESGKVNYDISDDQINDAVDENSFKE
jgi:S-DNA-T family DNA segregation ATPase FtsK/SpoIIIE